MTEERAIIKPGLKTGARKFARPRNVSFYNSLDRLANASERTASLIKRCSP